MQGAGAMLVAKLEILGDIDRRGAIRLDADSPSTLRAPDGQPIDVIVDDFSRTGFHFTANVDLPIGTLVSLGLSGAGSRAAQVMRRRDNGYGCAFMKALSDEEIGRAFKGQEAILAEISSALEARFAFVEGERNKPLNRVKALLEALRRSLRD
ncbi:PilZ domain-containing protein [Sphingomonas caeni]|uniref:PilZ domain-containing protein n=1 Tax=Sphingomonas caeni TaxID=2984949 RepID=UPI00223283D9|nr:PilZ domain-containing protein [Sphingomonas caeni]